MTHAIDAGLIVFTVSVFLYIPLGAWVLTLAPRGRQTTLLGAFAVLFGLSFVFWTVAFLLHTRPAVLTPAGIQPLWFPGEAAQGLASVTALSLAAYVPRRQEERRPLVAAVAIGSVLGPWGPSGGSRPTSRSSGPPV